MKEVSMNEVGEKINFQEITKGCRDLNVQGHHHKGHVYIFVNGSDLFDVYLTTTQGTIKMKIEGLYFDQLVEWIDEKVEKIPDYIRQFLIKNKVAEM